MELFHRSRGGFTVPPIPILPAQHVVDMGNLSFFLWFCGLANDSNFSSKNGATGLKGRKKETRTTFVVTFCDYGTFEDVSPYFVIATPFFCG